MLPKNSRSTLRVVRIGCLVASATLTGVCEVVAQSSEDATSAPAVYSHESAPTAAAVRTTASISVDGRLSEAAWQAAPATSGFLQTEPDEGRPASQVTEVRLLYDDDAIYVGARLSDDGQVTSRLARRDSGFGDSDNFVVLFDSFHDHETAYRFWTNPSGVKGDAFVSGGRGGFGRGGGDSSWDPVWDVATTVTEDGWFAEMRIPFSQLRFSREEIQTWGVQFERNIHRTQEHATFPFTPRLEAGGVQRYGHLEGIRGIEPGRRLEVLPYVVARGEYLQLSAPSGVGFSNPYRSGSDHFGGVGADLKYRLTSNVTLDATVNPDFGQVELDPSVINLTAFETRFDERRPFFVEGADIFRFGEGGPAGSVGRPPQMLYSRRIGRRPRGSAPSSAVFSDVPTATTIHGAAKVTGRFGDGWSIGVLEAVTADESATFVDNAQQSGQIGVEPAANNFVARIRRQFRGGATRVGAITTALNRDLTGNPLEDRLHGSAYTGGIDFAHETEDRMWMFSGLVAGSRVSGTSAALERTQRSSARYFQRPDADHLSVDPLATSMGGYYVMGFLGKQAGTITARNGIAWVSPGFESNDLGFQSLSDRFIFDTHYQYNVIEPGRHLRSWNVSASPDAVWNYDGKRVLGNVNSNINLQWLNYWRTNLRLEIHPWNEDDRLTRGGPMSRLPGKFTTRLTVNSDSRKTTTVRGNYGWTDDFAGGWNRSFDVSVNARFRESLQFSVSPSYSRSKTTAQYVQAVTDATAGATFGSRYVFGDLIRTRLSLRTRLNVTFSPDMSLQLYLEPFVSVGSYGALKELSSPGTFDFDVYGSDVGTRTDNVDGSADIDPDGTGPAAPFTVRALDFSYRSLLGNAVLRWDWRPGSTIYFVWQQRRINSLVGPGATGAYPWVGSFDLGRDAEDMFGIAPDNVLMVKMNYWLNP